MRYIPHTEQDVKQMLAEIGVKNIDELFDSIPESLRLTMSYWLCLQVFQKVN